MGYYNYGFAGAIITHRTTALWINSLNITDWYKCVTLLFRETFIDLFIVVII